MRLLEDMLERYEMPYDKRNPMVCLDEKPGVLHVNVQAGLHLAAGCVERRDDENERHGTANLFVLVEPLEGVLVLSSSRMPSVFHGPHGSTRPKTTSRRRDLTE
jgi:hypothetical protein